MEPLAVGAVSKNPNASIIEKQMYDLSQSSNQIEAQTGAVLRFVGDSDGLIKTAKYGNILFSVESVYLCKFHRFACREANCPSYLKLADWSGAAMTDLANQLPIGTQVNFFHR
jgi:hypothetical protein